MIKFKKDFWLTVFSLVFIGWLAFYHFEDVLAKRIWQNYQNPQLALFFNRSDSDLAMFIGNYYFNGIIGSHAYDLAIAERAFKKAVSINPKILWGHYQLSRIYFVKGDYAGALEEINKELEFNSENLRSLYVRGLIYGYRNYSGDLEKAEEDFRRFTRWAPKEWAGYNDLAWILSKEGKYKEAEEAILAAQKEISDAETNPWLWNSLGVAELNLKNYASAAISFEKAGALAEKLTVEEWSRAYPANNSRDAANGLRAFQEAIEENLARSRDVP